TPRAAREFPRDRRAVRALRKDSPVNQQMIVTRRTLRHRASVDVADLWSASRVHGARCPAACGVNLALVVYPRAYQFRCTRCAWTSELLVVKHGLVASASFETMPPPRPL